MTTTATKARKHSRAGATKTAPSKKRGASGNATKKMSALDAAARVLGEAGKALSCAELIEAMTAKRYWKSPAGKTPEATLYSSIVREIKTQGSKSRFKKTAPGHFASA